MAKRSAGSEDPWPQPNNQQEMKSEKSTWLSVEWVIP
jgi:hypothetical protein